VKKRRFIGRLSVPALVVTVLALVAPASSQIRPPYTDSTGDSSSAADISGISVLGNRANGRLLFGISGSNFAKSSAQVTFLGIDSDANPATGNPGWNGSDYALIIENGGYDFVHWHGSEWVEAPSSTVRVCCPNNASFITFSVNRRELSNTSDFNFSVRTLDTDTLATDRAPDAGMYNYSFAAGGPDIRGIVLQTTPISGPTAGSRFVVTPAGVKLPPDGAAATVSPHPDGYACRTTLNGRAVHGTDTGGCTLQLGKRTRGEKLRVVVTVVYEGATKRMRFTFLVS
jgi:hypothetical protein